MSTRYICGRSRDQERDGMWHNEDLCILSMQMSWHIMLFGFGPGRLLRWVGKGCLLSLLVLRGERGSRGQDHVYSEKRKKRRTTRFELKCRTQRNLISLICFLTWIHHGSLTLHERNSWTLKVENNLLNVIISHLTHSCLWAHLDALESVRLNVLQPNTAHLVWRYLILHSMSRWPAEYCSITSFTS